MRRITRSERRWKARVGAAAFVATGMLLPARVAPAPAEVATTYREAISVELANVDVVVEDREGKPVQGLGREDFTVLVDGRPVELTNFAAYRFDAAPPRAAAPSASPAAAPPAVASPATSPAAEPPPAATWVVYVDFSRLRHFARVEAVRQTRRFLERSMHPGEEVLVVGFDTRALRVLGKLGDAAAAGRALEGIEGRAAIPGQPVALDADPIERAANEQEFELALQLQIGAFRDLLSIVDALEGRVALLLVGGGMDLSGVADDRRGVLLGDYRRLLERANSGRVTMYSIYAGPDRFPPVGADTPKDQEPDLLSKLDAAVDAPTPEGRSTLAAFAEETGGLSFVSAKDLAASLSRARDDFDIYYSLGYRPPAGSSAKRQKLEVRVRDERLHVRHRRELRGRSPEQTAEEQTLAALLASPTSARPAANPLGLTVEVGTPQPVKLGRGLRVPVALRLPIGGLTLLAEGGRHLGRLAFQFVIEDPDGGYRRLEPRELPLEIPAAKLAAARQQRLGYSFELQLLQGTYRLAVTASDMVGGVHSTLAVPIEVGNVGARNRRPPGFGPPPLDPGR